MLTGRWKIIDYQMIFYDTDGVTPLNTYDLFDDDGNPTNIGDEVWERVPV